MKCEFSETRFVFGILHELANRCFATGRGWKAPNLPTQREEKELGYDVEITGAVRSIFFQFKIPEKKTTANSKYWNEMGGPYYEFHIWPDSTSPQHNNLLNLAASNPRNKVYYCSPRFHTNREYEVNYRNKAIASNSVYVPCGTLMRITGSDAHSICYTKDPRTAPVMHSEPHFATGFGLDQLWSDIENSPTYQNASECLFLIAEKFSIDVRDKNNTVNMYYEIANYLLMNENLIFILMGQ